MFFYVDESGHTGAHLFDTDQPTLYYGVLSSKLNIDLVAEKYVLEIRNKIGIKRLHAAELGNRKLVSIVDGLIKIQEEFQFVFDIYSVIKPDHALISFFDQVFDQGLNPAVPWAAYWTPLRYMLLLNLSRLFDEKILKRAWAARIEIDNGKAELELISICSILRSRVGILPDKRSQKIITDALKWAEDNPKKIGYNINDKSELLSITPNLIGFQIVMQGIASRITAFKVKHPQIIVDQQSQFNKSQSSLADFFAKASKMKFENGPGLPEIDFSGMPTIPIRFKSSDNSVGLELVDVYLWIFKRFIEKKELAPELLPIIKLQLDKGVTNEVSVNGLAERWRKWFEDLPEPTKEQGERSKELMALAEKRRLNAIKQSRT